MHTEKNDRVRRRGLPRGNTSKTMNWTCKHKQMGLNLLHKELDKRRGMPVEVLQFEWANRRKWTQGDNAQLHIDIVPLLSNPIQEQVSLTAANLQAWKKSNSPNT